MLKLKNWELPAKLHRRSSDVLKYHGMAAMPLSGCFFAIVSHLWKTTRHCRDRPFRAPNTTFAFLHFFAAAKQRGLLLYRLHSPFNAENIAVIAEMYIVTQDQKSIKHLHDGSSSLTLFSTAASPSTQIEVVFHSNAFCADMLMHPEPE